MGKVLGMAWEDTGNELWLPVSRKEICRSPQEIFNN